MMPRERGAGTHARVDESDAWLRSIRSRTMGRISVPSRRRKSGSAEFWPAAENAPIKYGRRKRRRNLESRSAAEKKSG